MNNMNNTNKDKFESLWIDFVTLVKGKLITTAKKQTLSTALANLILSEAAAAWSSDYEINGRWIMELEKEDMSKCELIKEVLTKDMKFSEIIMKKELPDYYNYLVPTIGAGVGYASSYLLDFGKIAQIVSIIAPAIMLYPAVKMFRQNQIENNIAQNVNSYLEQLAKYRDSVLAILS